MVFLILHMLVLGNLAERGMHCSVLMIWLAVGCVYNAVIWGRFGSNAGISWFAGYLLEFIFLVENIFIFHIIIQAFKVPAKLTRKALHIVVWGQITFEMIFFMGLAAWLRSFKVLPYLLGVWLICCGFLAAHGNPQFEGEIMETSACRAFTSCLGDRLSPSFEKDGECLLRDAEGKMKVSLLGLVVVVLLAADFLLEIDVVLTKIEELPNPYIAFTSSAVAAFSIPELFFVTKGMMKRFPTLKYGIGFVLVLFGTQMLLSSFYILRPIVACCIIVGVLAVCILVSFFQSMTGCGSADDTSVGSAGAALSEAGTATASTSSSEAVAGSSSALKDEHGNPQEQESDKADALNKSHS
jgi:predicted tellurium resistance membrane protein TerC